MATSLVSPAIAGLASLALLTALPAQASITTIGTPCNLQSAPLQLGTTGLPAIGNGGFEFVLLGGGATGGAARIFFTLDQQTPPTQLPNGCFLHLDATRAVASTTMTVGGVNRFVVPFPLDNLAPSFSVLDVYVQAIQDNAGNFDASDALKVEFRPAISFASQVYPIFSNSPSCVACHTVTAPVLTDANAAHVALVNAATATSTCSGTLVVPNDPTASVLLDRPWDLDPRT